MSGLKNLAPLLAAFAGWAFAAPDASAQWTFPGFSQTQQQPEPAPQGPPPQSTARGENFSAKPPAQLFVSDCTGSGCHKGPQGLGKGRNQFTLTGFLRAHYTNSRESAAAMAAYLTSLPGDARAARPERPQRAPARSDDAAKPSDDAARARRATPPADLTDAPKPAAAAKPQRERGRQATAAPSPPPAAEPAPPPEPVPPPEPPKPKWDIFD